MNVAGKSLFGHSEPPQAVKNLVLTAIEETLRLRLRVTDGEVLPWKKP
jgi:hypothetical protein